MNTNTLYTVLVTDYSGLKKTRRITETEFLIKGHHFVKKVSWTKKLWSTKTAQIFWKFFHKIFDDSHIKAGKIEIPNNQIAFLATRILKINNVWTFNLQWCHSNFKNIFKGPSFYNGGFPEQCILWSTKTLKMHVVFLFSWEIFHKSEVKFEDQKNQK